MMDGMRVDLGGVRSRRHLAAWAVLEAGLFACAEPEKSAGQGSTEETGTAVEPTGTSVGAPSTVGSDGASDGGNSPSADPGVSTDGESEATASEGGSTGAVTDLSSDVESGTGATANAVEADETQGSEQEPAVLVFSRTVAFRHDSIAAGHAALADLAATQGWSLQPSEDPEVFRDEDLASFDVIVFLSTTGDVLDIEQQGAFERFIRAGNGFVGVHAASDTEYEWPWYGGLVGAYFRAHPQIQPATIRVEDRDHPATSHLGEMWTRTDEWYAFMENPRLDVHVLLALDEESYAPGDSHMDGDHPIAWYHEYEGGRAFYTALGHTAESYEEPDVLVHLGGAIEWASGR